MRKYLLLFVVFALTTANVAMAQKTKSIELSLKKGKTYRQEITSETSTSQEISGMAQSMELSNSLDLAFKVKGINSDGNYEIEVKLKNFSMQISQNGMELTYATDAPNGENHPMLASQMDGVFEKIKNEEITMVLTKKGKVISTNANEILTPQQQQIFPLNKNTIEQMFSYIPEKEISKNSKFTKVEEDKGQKTTETSEFTVTSLSKKKIELSSNGKITATKKEEGKEDEVIEIGETSGTITIDGKTGLIINALSDKNVKVEKDGNKIESTTKGTIKRIL
ncbi:MAG: DUF6263 family protein [Bacteroidales bacterium]